MLNDKCSVAGCDSHVLARGWCGKHYSRWYTHGNPTGIAPRRAQLRPTTLCSVDNCEKAADTRGMCPMHYTRERRHGDAAVNLRPKGRNSTAKVTVPCSEDECNEPARTGGLCNRHYRNKTYAERGTCRIDGCEKTWQAAELCTMHYQRLRSHGTTDDLAPTPLRGGCAAEGCDDAVKARGLCGMHLRRWYRSGTTDTPITSGERTCRRCRSTLPADAVTKTSLICVACRPAWIAERTAKVLPKTKAVRARAAALRVEQNGCCAICNIREADATKGTLHVDHIHGTEIIRGLLCSECNTGLGMFRDDPARLQAAIGYLNRSTPAAVG